MTSLEEAIGYEFRDRGLLQEALTHTSHAHESASARHNERLEFLGDSVLGLAVAHYLFEKNPSESEGFLSDTRAALVSSASQARWAASLGLGHHLRLGAGERSKGGAEAQNNLANAVEALLGAVFLDGGLPPVVRIVRGWLDTSAFTGLEANHKKALQEFIQKRHQRPPDYEIVSQEGPDHARTFKVRVFLGKKTLGLGSGRSKREAQQEAARNALDYLSSHKLTRDDL